MSSASDCWLSLSPAEVSLAGISIPCGRSLLGAVSICCMIDAASSALVFTSACSEPVTSPGKAIRAPTMISCITT
ncbi:hypothetical protein D3C78_1443600 [compost metagenome]